MKIKEDLFRYLFAALMSLITFFGAQIWSNQADMACRIRSIELQQARIMERLGITDSSASVDYSGVQRHYSATLDNP
jgi:hypothetical protein